MPSYSSSVARWLLGASAHPGGDAATRHAAAIAGVAPGALVLDVGCGRGGSALLLARESGARVTGIDVEARAVAAAHRAGVRVLRGDALELPVPDAAYDVVLCECALSTVPAPGRAVAEMARALRPGGRLVLSDVVAELDLRRRHPRVDQAVRRLTTPQPIAGYADLVARARLVLEHQESRAADADALLRRVEQRLALGRVVPAVRAARATVAEARVAIREGSLDYTLIVARKPLR